jgi:hypothetical protein
MPEADFRSEIFAHEVVVTHLATGHSYPFPLSPNGTAALNGARIEEKAGSTANARKFLFEAQDVTRIALGRAST